MRDMVEFPYPLIQNLKSRPLPGPEVQFQMAHARRQIQLAVPDHARLAAVMCVLYPVNLDWHFVLIRRTGDWPNDRHGGQVSFPGGKQDENDGTLEITALRECREELGIAEDRIQVVGALSPLYIPVSNFLVHPYIGFLEDRPLFQVQETEVAQVLEVRLEALLHPESRRETDIRINEHITLRRVPYFSLNDQVVWGATAMMLNEFRNLLAS